MTKADDPQIFSFEIERVLFKHLRSNQFCGNLAWKARLQKDFTKSGAIWFCMPATLEAVANALALGNLSSKSCRPKK